MALKEIQGDVDQWVNQYTVGYFPPLEILARLTEENGEVAREINHRFGSKKKKLTEKMGDLEEEIGDMIFTLVCLANSQEINLDDAWKKVMNKCYGRDRKRFKRR